MREILFRGKRADNGEWVEGYYSPCVIPIAGTIGHFINEGGYRAVEIDPETVGQYTGLTDKNGTKIFEGDIVKCKHTIYIYGFCPEKADHRPRRSYGHTLVYNDFDKEHKNTPEKMIYYRNYTVEYRGGHPRLANGSDQHNLSDSLIYWHEVEIVGNIFDNSELLKREKSKNEKDGDGK